MTIVNEKDKSLNKNKTIGEFLEHDFETGDLRLYNYNQDIVYFENSTGFWYKKSFDENRNTFVYKDSTGHVTNDKHHFKDIDPEVLID